MANNIKKLFSRMSYLSVSILGLIYRINIKYLKINEIKINKTEKEINISVPNNYKYNNETEIINYCIQKIYDEVAKREIEDAMEFSRHILGFAPEDYIIKRMNNTYFKCSKKVITINPDIASFSREVIYTTIIRAFCKAQYREGSNNYIKALDKGLREYETYKHNKKM